VKIRTSRLDWTDLQFFVELARARNLSAAARALNVTHATVGRRLQALEESLGYPLFVRGAGGYTLTADGERIIAMAEAMDAQVRSISRVSLGRAPDLTGLIRITSTETFASRFVMPRLQPFVQAHPGLQVELIGDQRNLSLARGDADVALRFAPPAGGEQRAKLVGHLRYRFYAKAGQVPRTHDETLAYIGYSEGARYSVESQHFEKIVGTNAVISVLTNTQLVRLAAVRAGLGIGLLPQYLGDADPELARFELGGPALSREIWLIVHKDLVDVPRIKACMDFIEETMEGSREQLSGE
jgi:DNA-binding transcriptional LysR family regulator